MQQDIIEFPNSSNSPDFIYKIDSLKKFQDNILKPYLEREKPEYQWTDSTCDITPTKACHIKKMSPLLKKKEDVSATDSIVFNVVNMTKNQHASPQISSLWVSAGVFCLCKDCCLML